MHKFKSVIERDQLGPHLRQLVDAGFLTSYVLEPAKTRDGVVITFKPGRTFFDDYDRFYRKQQHGALRRASMPTARRSASPSRLPVRREKDRRLASSIGFVNSKDVETAKQLLTKISFDDMPAFLDYALAEARSTSFDVQTLSGLKQYVAGYLATRERRAAAHRRRTSPAGASERDDRLRSEYDAYCRNEAARILAGLPKAAKAVIESDARPHVASFIGPLREQMLEVRKRMLTAQRYGDRIKSFEGWKAAQARGVNT